MTKAKALKLMHELSRNVIDPALARKIAQAFGYSLTQLGLKASKVRDFDRLNYSHMSAELSAISVYQLADRLCTAVTGEAVHSNMLGRGSYAQDITEKALAKLSN